MCPTLQLGDIMGRTVQMPGAEATAEATAEAGDSQAVDPRDAELASLRAQLAAKEEAAKLPQVVYEPLTPKGKFALEASAFAHLSVAELIAEIDAGRCKEPITSVLCRDGYYARRS